MAWFLLVFTLLSGINSIETLKFRTLDECRAAGRFILEKDKSIARARCERRVSV